MSRPDGFDFLDDRSEEPLYIATTPQPDPTVNLPEMLDRDSVRIAVDLAWQMGHAGGRAEAAKQPRAWN